MFALILTVLPGVALAQETDDRWLVGLGIAPLGYERATTDFPTTSQTASVWRAGPGGDATLLVGRGMEAWVVALELSLRHTSESVEQEVDITSSASVVAVESSSTRVSVGPDVRYLFSAGAVRPFVEAGGGFAWTHGDLETSASDVTTFYGQLAPGVQLELVPFASLDLLLRAQYSAGSGEYAPGFVLDPGTGMQLRAEPVDIDVRAIEVGLHARLSLWL